MGLLSRGPTGQGRVPGAFRRGRGGGLGKERAERVSLRVRERVREQRERERVGHSEGKRRGERRIDYGRSDGTVTRGPDLRPRESRPAAAISI